jgi:hypothetical protein
MKAKFELGQVVATQGALAALEDANQSALPFVQRHQQGDWGDICKEDKKLNDEAIAFEGDIDKQNRVMSSYMTNKNVKIWIITEYDRSVSTVLLPSDY